MPASALRHAAVSRYPTVRNPLQSFKPHTCSIDYVELSRPSHQLASFIVMAIFRADNLFLNNPNVDRQLIWDAQYH